MSPSSAPTKRVGLFVTCLVDFMRPSVGFAAIKLLEQAGCHVEVPTAQTCCGQPAFNSGDNKEAKAIAQQVIEAFEGFDAVVIPSGSCGGMMAKHYPELFQDDTKWQDRAEAFAAKCYELISYLSDELGLTDMETSFPARATYHDSCSGLRELKIKDQPRRLMKSVAGLDLVEMEDPDTCCGFGGTFCVKYTDISNKMVERKIASIVATGADTLVAGDMGCLMNMAGKLKRAGHDIDVRHTAEVLAGDVETPGIGRALRVD